MKKILQAFLIGSILFLLFNQCSFQKRLYQQGYYIHYKKTPIRPTNYYSANTPTKKYTIDKKDELLSVDNSILKKISTNAHPVDAEIASTSKLYIPVISSKKPQEDSCGDKIIMKTGDEFLVKIIEITNSEIKYKRCDNLDGPLYTISKSKVYLIEYKNGIKEHMITEPENTQKPTEYSGKEQYPNHYWTAWILFAVGFISLIGVITWPLAMFHARSARRQIAREPNKYKGKPAMGCLMYGMLGVCILSGLAVIFLGSLMVGNYSVSNVIFIVFAALFLIPVVIFFLTSQPDDY